MIKSLPPEELAAHKRKLARDRSARFKARQQERAAAEKKRILAERHERYVKEYMDSLYVSRSSV